MVLKGFKKNEYTNTLKVKSVSVLGTNQLVEWTYTADGLQVVVPVILGDKAMTFKVECEK